MGFYWPTNPILSMELKSFGWQRILWTSLCGKQVMSTPQSLLEKIRSLPAERLEEVEDFIDFLTSRASDRSLVRAAKAASAQSFAEVWNNPEDDDYDAL